MQPAFKIIAQGRDITALIADRLVELSVTDEAGIKSDKLRIELDDRDQLFQLPSKGAVLRVSLGWVGQPLVAMGVYTVDEIEVTGGPRSLSISASATDFNSSISSQQERSWHDTTLGEIARKIAAEHDLEPVVSAKMAKVKIAHVDQTESSLQLLTRLAAQYGGVVKTPDGKLVLAERGRTKSVSGQKLEAITITPGEFSSWSMTATGRGTYQAVKAYWQDKGKAKRTGEVAGSTDKKARTMSLPHTYASKEEAQEAANSKLEAMEKGEAKLSIKDMPGNTNIFAEQRVIASGFRQGVDGEWVATKVEHKISGSGGFTTDIELELPGSKKDDDEDE